MPGLFVNEIASGLLSHALGDGGLRESANLAELWSKWLPGCDSLISSWV